MYITIYNKENDNADTTHMWIVGLNFEILELAKCHGINDISPQGQQSDAHRMRLEVGWQ